MYMNEQEVGKRKGGEKDYEKGKEVGGCGSCGWEEGQERRSKRSKVRL